MQIQYTSAISMKDGVKAVVFGGSGVGKTVLLASAPEPIILSAEDGLLSLRKMKVPYIDISNYKQLTEAYTWLIQSSEAKRYQTYGLDSLSEIAECVLGEELKKTADPRRAYGETQQQMYRLIRTVRDIPNKHKVMIAKEQTIETGPGIKCAVAIMPSEKLQAQLPYFFDLVLHMYVATNPSNGQSYRAIHTAMAANWNAKDRSGNLDPVEFPNLTQIFTKATS